MQKFDETGGLFMKNATRRVSMLLAVLMVLSLLTAFPALVVGAADTNYALGIVPTVTKGGAELAPAGGSNAGLTDGVYATAEGDGAAHYFSGVNGLAEFVFDLGETKTDLSSVYASVRYTGNRSFEASLASVEISSDGSTYTAVSGEKTFVASSTANYYDFTYAFYATQSARYVKVTLASAAYVLSLSEIEIRNYGLSEGGESSVDESTDDPTLVEGNYAYGASYDVVRDDGAAIAYRNVLQTDSGTWLTDGYVGTGAAGGTNYYTVGFAGTGRTYTITLTLTQSYSDIAYLTLENVLAASGTSICLPSSVSVKTSADGITYNDVTVTESQVAEANGATDITYTFASAVAGQYVQFTFTSVGYVVGFDEIVIGGSGSVPEVSVEPTISADADVKTSTTATNYAASSMGAYYQYGDNSTGLPHTSYTDNNWVGFNGASLDKGVYGQGDLNDGVYATGNYSDAAWVGFAHSEAYNTVNSIELIFDLAAVYGDIDQIAINWYVHAGEEGNDASYADPTNGITVSFGDYEGVYGAATKVYAGTVTETAGTGYTTYKAQFAVGSLTGNVRFVKIVLPKPGYRLFIDEVEIIGASGYDVEGTAPVESSEASSTESSAESSADSSVESRLPGEGSYVVDPMFEVSLSVDITTVDPDGDGTEYSEQQYAVVDLYIKNIQTYDRTTLETYPYGIAGIDGYLEFDEENLVPVWYSDVHLNGDSASSVEAKTLYNWPKYTITVPALGISYQMFSYEGVCTPYATLDSEGNLTNTDGTEQGYTMGKGYIRCNYIINIDNHVGFNDNGVCLTDDDAVQLRYYFYAKDGSFDAGESFYFAVPDNPDATTTAAATLRAPYYTGHTDNTAFTTGYGKGAYAYLNIPEAAATYTVTFLDKDGNQIGDAQTVTEGEDATAPEAPEVDGFTFTGWDKDYTSVTSDLTVTAQYEQIMVTVSFVAGEGGSLTGTTSVSVAYGTDLSTVTFPTAVADDNYEFSAWSQTSGVITADITVTATFTEVADTPAEFFVFADGVDTTNYVVSTTNPYIYIRVSETSADAFIAMFADENITITKANGTTAVSGSTAFVATAYLATSTIGDQSETRTIIVFGDVNGDGKVTGSDYSQALNCSKGKLTITGVKRIAANVVQPTKDTINGSDYNAILNVARKRRASFTTAAS